MGRADFALRRLPIREFFQVNSAPPLAASCHQFYEQFTSACLAWTGALPKYYVFFGLIVIELRRRVDPLT
jgi:hypothetical protein